MNIIDKTDEELLEIGNPWWEDLIKYSNKGQYGKFIRNFSYDLFLGLNEVELGKQFSRSDLLAVYLMSMTFLDLSVAVNMSLFCIEYAAPRKKANGWADWFLDTIKKVK